MSSISKRFMLSFLCGAVFGSMFTYLAIYHQSLIAGNPWKSFQNARFLSKKDLNENISISRQIEELGINATVVSKFKFLLDRVENVTASQLYKKVRVLCWVMTSPPTLERKATAVRDTWAKRCNIRLFMSSVENKDFPAVGLPVKEGRDQLYEKTKAAYKYVWENYRDEADWFMKADDDTYVIVENLRYLLKDYDPSQPSFFGRRFKPFFKQGYMSGGAGYVLSKEALKRYVTGLESKKCPKGGGVEDVEMGRCLDLVGVKALDSRDSSLRETFFPLGPTHHLIKDSIPKDNWFWKYNYYPTCMGRECCSNYPITFHYVSPQNMYVYDYMIYDVETYGASHSYARYPYLPYYDKKKEDNEKQR